MEGGVHRERGPNHWQESRDSHLTQPQFCPNDGIHLTLIWLLPFGRDLGCNLVPELNC